MAFGSEWCLKILYFVDNQKYAEYEKRQMLSAWFVNCIFGRVREIKKCQGKVKVCFFCSPVGKDHSCIPATSFVVMLGMKLRESGKTVDQKQKCV